MMRWFGRKGGSGAARPALARSLWAAAVAGEGWPRSYEAQVRDSCLGNPVAQRAMRMVAEGVAGIPVYTEPDAHPAIALFGPARGGRALLEAAAAQLLLHGNAFLQIGCDAQGMPLALHALRPERVTVEQDARGWPAAYLYRAGEKGTRYPATDPLGKPILRDPFTNKPFVNFYACKRVGGGVANSEAIKLMKFAAS